MRFNEPELWPKEKLAYAWCMFRPQELIPRFSVGGYGDEVTCACRDDRPEVCAPGDTPVPVGCLVGHSIAREHEVTGARHPAPIPMWQRGVRLDARQRNWRASAR